MGEIFNPARDCPDIVDQLPEAEDGFYWIVLPKGTKQKVYPQISFSLAMRPGVSTFRKGKQKQAKYTNTMKKTNIISLKYNITYHQELQRLNKHMLSSYFFQRLI